MKMRPDTIMKPHFDMLNVTLDPLIATAPERLSEQEAQNIAEDRLSLLYTDLVPASLLQKNTIAQQSLAQRMKNMSHINLGATSKKPKTLSSRSNDDDDEGDEDSDFRDSEGDRSSGGRSRTISCGGGELND